MPRKQKTVTLEKYLSALDEWNIDAAKLEKAEATLAAIAKLPDEWRGVIERAKVERRHDQALNRGMTYLSSAANNLEAIIKEI